MRAGLLALGIVEIEVVVSRDIPLSAPCTVLGIWINHEGETDDGRYR
jgi:hypothetical protein